MKVVILSNAIPFKNFCNFIRKAFMLETCYFKNSRREGKFAREKRSSTIGLASNVSAMPKCNHYNPQIPPGICSFTGKKEKENCSL